MDWFINKCFTSTSQSPPLNDGGVEYESGMIYVLAKGEYTIRLWVREDTYEPMELRGKFGNGITEDPNIQIGHMRIDSLPDEWDNHDGKVDLSEAWKRKSRAFIHKYNQTIIIPFDDNHNNVYQHTDHILKIDKSGLYLFLTQHGINEFNQNDAIKNKFIHNNDGTHLDPIYRFDWVEHTH